MTTVPGGTEVTVSVEHPTGESREALGLDSADPQQMRRSALRRTARLIVAGEVFAPSVSGSPRP